MKLIEVNASRSGKMKQHCRTVQSNQAKSDWADGEQLRIALNEKTNAFLPIAAKNNVTSKVALIKSGVSRFGLGSNSKHSGWKKKKRRKCVR